MKVTAYLFLKLNLVKAVQPTRRIFVVGKACITSLLFTTFIVVNGLQTAVTAQITPATNDAGTVVNQNGDTLNIEGGTQAGANLLHSFEKFGVNEGQTANFISNPEIKNILGRVTGGNASIINGTIQVTGGNSNLYLMNPSGIIFGSGASLNVPASFTATTANGIELGDKWFNAVGTNDYANLIGNPSAFAFTMNQPGAIVNNGNLNVGAGKNLTLVGGTVLNTGKLRAWGGQVVVATVAGERVVRISQPGNILTLEVQPLSTSANLPAKWSLPILSLPQLLTGGGIGGIRNASTVTVSGDQVTLTGSGIEIQNGDVVAGSILAQNATLSSNRNLIFVRRAGQELTIAGDLNIEAQNTVEFRDSLDTQDFFALQVGGNLKVQGNQGIDIELNNQRSIFSTGGNLNLVSDGTITGNTAFITGGNFSVLNLSGGAGTFTSSFLSSSGTNTQGIISSNGDVNFGNYEGYSLKVEAKGSITGGDINITKPNGLLVGTDPDIAVLKSTPSLILRAGVSELRNSPSTPSISLGGTTFVSTATPTSSGSITVGNITISRSASDPVVGPVILSATGDININRNGNGNGNIISGASKAVVFNSSKGGITVTENIDTAGSIILSSEKDIITKNISAGSSYAPESDINSDVGFFSSRKGNILVDDIEIKFGSLDINAAGVFQAKAAFSPSFNTPDNVPVSVKAERKINIQHGGVSFTSGLGVERDADGNPIFREVENAYGDTVRTVKSVNFDPNTVPSDASYTNGLIILSSGSNQILDGIFRDTQLSSSNEISVVSAPPQNPKDPLDPPKPRIDISVVSDPPQNPKDPLDPPKPRIDISVVSDPPQNPKDPLDPPKPGIDDSQAQAAQRQLNKPSQNSACPPSNTVIALNSRENPTRSETTNPPTSTTANPCREENKDTNILRIIRDNQTKPIPVNPNPTPPSE